jgi:hypothetical protein
MPAMTVGYLDVTSKIAKQPRGRLAISTSDRVEVGERKGKERKEGHRWNP